MKIVEQFVAAVVAYKRATGISDYEFARRAGLQESMIRRIDFDRVFEKGQPSITLRTAFRIEDAMGRFPITNGAEDGKATG
jgi:hypothetical protein